MFLVGFRGCALEDAPWLVRAIERDRLGGVLLFDRNVDGSRQNIESAGQLRSLTASLRRRAGDMLFIAADQEGGRVRRLKERDGFPPASSAAELAEQGLEATKRQAGQTARLLADCGINLNFAPVVDLNLNQDNPAIARHQRSFGQDPEVVVAHAAAWIEAHHCHGLGCCLKHFPGHGSANQDSHLGFVDITACWQERELEPYRRLVHGGYIDGIMTAHLVHRGLDPSGLPATLSPALITGLLREKLSFTGPIFSDDLQMQAISRGWSNEEAVQRAVLAGIDVLVIGNNLALHEDAVTTGIKAIQSLLDRGKISEGRIRASLARIARFKETIARRSWQSCAPKGKD